MEEIPKIDEVIERFTEMSKIFYQIMILANCLDRLVQNENTLGKIKQNVSSFITNFENCVKDFTSHETVLTAYLKGNIDLSKMDIKDDSKKMMLKRILKKVNLPKLFLCVPKQQKKNLFFKNERFPKR